MEVAIKGLVMVMVLSISTRLALSQISTPCTTSMISSFTPCLNFITGSSGNGASPNTGCCSSLGSLVSSSAECACLIVTGNVPLNLPINRTLAVSLPRACNMAPVPLQCKASAAPLPAPGPSQFGPPLPPSPAASPDSSSSAIPPLPDTSSEVPPEASPTISPLPPSGTGLRPVVNPSSASRISYMQAPPLLVLLLGMAALKYF